MTKEQRSERTPATRVTDTAQITAALRLGVREALWQHKQLGHHVVVWRDGRVQRIPPEQIPGPESDFWVKADKT